MKVRDSAYDVGVILGRFQVDELHEAHKSLFEHVIANHERVFCFIGLNGAGQPTKENPLDYEARKQMIEEAYPDVICGFIKDIGDDVRWSRNFDGLVGSLLNPGQSVVLYGGRDSFIHHYTGALPTRELEPDVWISGTEIRRKVSKRVKASKFFRQGVIWAMANRFPVVFPTVDIAIIDKDGQVVLGRKPDEAAWRFIGGFVDTTDKTFEAAAQREALEETGLVVSEPKYLGSFPIDDWRYRGEADSIMTSFFTAMVVSGDPRPGDDIKELRRSYIDRLTHDDVMPNHRVLLDRLQAGRNA